MAVMVAMGVVPDRLYVIFNLPNLRRARKSFSDNLTAPAVPATLSTGCGAGGGGMVMTVMSGAARPPDRFESGAIRPSSSQR